MKYFLSLFSLLLILSCKTEVPDPPSIITYDIDNFWEAYDKITSTEDSVEQHAYLQEFFIKKGSPGLDGMMRARNYTPQEYIDAINNYPNYWTAIREKTYRAKGFAEKLERGVQKLKKIYPDLKPAKIYFTIGVLRSNGTSIDGMLLIGSELAMGDSTINTDEFPEFLGHLSSFFKNNPYKSVVDLNIHEYIHSQQNAIGGYDLLSQSIYEGVAEFVPVKALNKASVTPAISYGKGHNEQVKAKFIKEIFSPWINNWIWNSPDNEFGVRDLGYYVGYAMAEIHYDKSSDKQKAIKEMIELDYTDSLAIESFAESTGYFDRPLEELKKEFEASRPEVVRLIGLENGSKQVSPSLSTFTVEFSRPLDTRFRSTGYGPLGEEYFPKISSLNFSKDGKSATYTLAGLSPNTSYQLLVNVGFRDKAGIPIKPLLLEFATKEK